jgi:hypothetical protein
MTTIVAIHWLLQNVSDSNSGRFESRFYADTASKGTNVLTDFFPAQGPYLSLIQANTDLYGIPASDSEIAVAMRVADRR